MKRIGTGNKVISYGKERKRIESELKIEGGIGLARSRTVVVEVPNDEYVNRVQVVSDPTTSIKGIKFAREFTNEVATLQNSTDCGIYVLVSGEKDVYVGKSVHGVKRIQEHLHGEKEWEYAMLFVTDNKRFDGLVIDYLEYRFIRMFLESKYETMNKDNRVQEPTISATDRLVVSRYEEEIRFLLEFFGFDMTKRYDAEDILNEQKLVKKIEEFNLRAMDKFYRTEEEEEPVELRFEPVSGTEPIYFDGEVFLLKEGTAVSACHKGEEAGGGGKGNDVLEDLLGRGKVAVDKGNYRLVEDVEFSGPTVPAGLVSGRRVNGWDYYEGIRQVKQ